MILNIFLFFIPTLLISLFMHYLYKQAFTIKEFFIQIIVTFFVIMSVVFIDGYSNMYDVKYVHGYVTAKGNVTNKCDQTWSSYESPYCENYYTKSVVKSRYNASLKRTEVYTQTYYKAKYPWETDWYVYTSIGNYKINRADEQGAVEPQRYKIVEKNDPVTSTEHYNNYIKAASNSLYKSNNTNPELVIKRNSIYDYYNISNFYVDGYNGIDISKANDILAKLNSKFKNINLVFYATTDFERANALQAKWQGFKINDIVIVCLLDSRLGICNSVDVYSWSESSMVNYEIQTLWQGKPIEDYEKMLQNTFTYINLDYTEPKPEKYEYLKYNIELSNVAFYILICIIFLVSPLISYYFVRN